MPIIQPMILSKGYNHIVIKQASAITNHILSWLLMVCVLHCWAALQERISFDRLNIRGIGSNHSVEDSVHHYPSEEGTGHQHYS